MDFIEFSVKRRITITMIMLIVMVFGFVSYKKLGLDLLPDLEFPYVSIVTLYEGVGSEEIETLLTRPIEEFVSSVNGVKKITSTSSEGVSTVLLEFEWGVNLDFAAQDVREKLGWIQDYLPKDVRTPMVLKFNASNMPIIQYGVTGMENTIRLRKVLEKTVKPRLEKLDGIASVNIYGGKEREISIQVDPNKLRATQVSLDDIKRAVMASNLTLSGGHIESFQKEYLVRTSGYYTNMDEIRNTAVSVSQEGGQIIHLGDIATIKDTVNEVRGYERMNRESCVLLSVMKQSGKNTVTSVNNVKQAMKEIEKRLPPGVKLQLIFDQGDIIQKSIDSAKSDAMSGCFIAVIVLWLFLRAVRPTLTITVVIPISVLATFIGMDALGYTFNLMTLGGIALGIGNLMDNAVVVIENTFRHLEEGKSRYEAAVLGAREVWLPVLASTLSTCAVFIPLSLSPNIAGKLSRPLTLTVCIGQVVSLLAAVTIVPAIAATIFKRDRSVYEKIEGKGWVNTLNKRYTAGLTLALKHRPFVILGVIGAFIASIFLAKVLGTEFMPRQDVPITIVYVSLPEGSVLSETDHITKQVENLFLARKEVDACVSVVGTTSSSKYSAAQGGDLAGVHKAVLYVKFKDKKERNKTIDTVINEVRDQLPKLVNVEYRFQDISSSFFGSSGAPVQIDLFGADLAVLDRLADATMQRLAEVPNLKDLDKSLKKSKPEVHIDIDREKASRLGLSVYQIADAVQTAMQGTTVSYFRQGGDEYDIRVEFGEAFRGTLENLAYVNIHSPAGFEVPLSQVTTLEKSYGPITIYRKNQNRVITISGTNYERDLGSVMQDVRKKMDSLAIPESYFYEIGGAYEDMQKAFKDLGFALLLSIVLIYMIMAAQFESLLQPFIVMFTIPLGFIGVMFGLTLMGMRLSVPSLMGLVILMGIVTNNGIVMIDCINQLRSEGMSRKDAVIQGASRRLRPILITSVTTIVGMLPMAFSRGEGSETSAPLAASVSFGLLFGMVLTLFFIPSIYSIIDEVAARIKGFFSRLVIGKEA